MLIHVSPLPHFFTICLHSSCQRIVIRPHDTCRVSEMSLGKRKQAPVRAGSGVGDVSLRDGSLPPARGPAATTDPKQVIPGETHRSPDRLSSTLDRVVPLCVVFAATPACIIVDEASMVSVTDAFDLPFREREYSMTRACMVATKYVGVVRVQERHCAHLHERLHREFLTLADTAPTVIVLPLRYEALWPVSPVPEYDSIARDGSDCEMSVAAALKHIRLCGRRAHPRSVIVRLAARKEYSAGGAF